MAQFDALPALERDLRVDRWNRERETHDACGFRYSDCGDPERAFYPYRRVDYAEMERLAAQARYAALHEAKPYHDGSFKSWAKERSPSHPYHFSDGVHIDVALTDVAPWDAFLTDRNASPLPPTDDASEVSDGGNEA